MCFVWGGVFCFVFLWLCIGDTVLRTEGIKCPQASFTEQRANIGNTFFRFLIFLCKQEALKKCKTQQMKTRISTFAPFHIGPKKKTIRSITCKYVSIQCNQKESTGSMRTISIAHGFCIARATLPTVMCDLRTNATHDLHPVKFNTIFLFIYRTVSVLNAHTHVRIILPVNR